MIRDKISDVPDHLCTHCSYCWMGRCRALNAPHSQAYELKRENSVIPLCADKFETAGDYIDDKAVFSETKLGG